MRLRRPPTGGGPGICGRRRHSGPTRVCVRLAGAGLLGLWPPRPCRHIAGTWQAGEARPAT
eukprot:scaffold124446_cov61-Phaeocystis_antarctica.AAC.3